MPLIDEAIGGVRLVLAGSNTACNGSRRGLRQRGTAALSGITRAASRQLARAIEVRHAPSFT